MDRETEDRVREIVRSLVRETVEDIANLVVAPIDRRLSVLETKIECGKKERERLATHKWKMIGLGMGIPGTIATIVTLINLFA